MRIRTDLQVKNNLQGLELRGQLKYGLRLLNSDEKALLKNILGKISPPVPQKLNDTEVARASSIISKLQSYNKKTWETTNVIYRIFVSLKEFLHLGVTTNSLLQYVGAGKKIRNTDVAQILNELKVYKESNPHVRINFANFLKSRGYATVFNSLSFASDLTIIEQKGSGATPFWGTSILKDVDFEGITFRKCNFEWVNLSGSSFKNVIFDGCKLSHSVMNHVNFENVKIRNCNFTSTMFQNSTFFNVNLLNSILEYSSFTDSELSNVEIKKSYLLGADFLNAKVSNSSFSYCALQNVLLLNSSEEWDYYECTNANQITRPIILFPWNPSEPGVNALKTHNSLIRSESIPLRINYLPADIDTAALEKEVSSLLQTVDKSAENKSIPRQVIENSNASTEIQKILEKVSSATAYADGVLFPGGADIQPEFYGSAREKKTQTEGDYRRSILEFGILHAVDDRKLPFLGICRGAQMGNVYRGGNLVQDVPGHTKQVMKVQLKSGAENSRIAKIAGHSFKAISMHHQAMKDMGEGLAVTMEGKGIPKIAEDSDESRFFLLSQIHPEYIGDTDTITGVFVDLLLSHENAGIFKSFNEHALHFMNSK